MEENGVTLKVIMTQEDYLKFQKEYQALKGTNFILIFAIVMIITMTLIFKPNFTSPISIIPYSVIVLGIITTTIRLPGKIKETWIKQYNSDKALQREQTYIIKADGIKCSSEITDARYNWSNLFAWLENGDAFMIFISESQCFYIPKRYFENNNQNIELVRSHLQNLPLYKNTTKKNPLKKILLIGAVIYVVTFLFVILMLKQ